MSPASGRRRFWLRLCAAIVVAYLCAFLAEGALGQWDPRRVGWSLSYTPVIVMGAAFGLAMGGGWGVLLAPLPLLLAPETWARIHTLWGVIGPAGVLILAQPLPPLWVASAVGVGARRFLVWLARR